MWRSSTKQNLSHPLKSKQLDPHIILMIVQIFSCKFSYNWINQLRVHVPNKYTKLLFSCSLLLLFGATTGSGPLLCVPHDPGKLPAQFGLLPVVQLLAQQWDVGIGIRPPRPLHIATGSLRMQ